MRKTIWLPFSILALLIAQVIIWMLIVEAVQDRVQAETRARLPVIIEQLRENSLCMKLNTQRSIPAGSSFTLLGPSEDIIGVVDTIADYSYFTGEKIAAVRLPSMPLQLPCALDIQVKFRFMMPPGGLLDTVTTGLGPAVAEQLGKALWTHRGAHRLKLLDTILLADLVEKELLIGPLDEVQYAVIDSISGDIIHASAGFDPERSDPRHTIPVFARDQSGLPWKLAIAHPHEQRSIMLAEMPLLLTLIIIAAAVSLLVTQYVRAAREQRKLADMRVDLVSNISHEFNTPIANIALALETLRKAPGTGSRISNEQLWDIVHMESRRLQGTIRKVLDVSLFESERIALSYEVHDLHDLLRASADQFKLRSEQEQVMIEPQFHAQRSWVKVDATYLGHVFQSLLDNAIKYGGRGVGIKLMTKDHDKGVIVEIIDDGPGIAKEDRQRVFEKFYRARRSDRYAIKGTGIGLYHARQVIEAHGGWLRLEDTAHGTSFRMLIPIETEHYDALAGSRG